MTSSEMKMQDNLAKLIHKKLLLASLSTEDDMTILTEEECTGVSQQLSSHMTRTMNKTQMRITISNLGCKPNLTGVKQRARHLSNLLQKYKKSAPERIQKETDIFARDAYSGKELSLTRHLEMKKIQAEKIRKSTMHIDFNKTICTQCGKFSMVVSQSRASAAGGAGGKSIDIIKSTCNQCGLNEIQ